MRSFMFLLVAFFWEREGPYFIGKFVEMTFGHFEWGIDVVVFV